MKLKDIYKTAIELGIKADPRGEAKARESLKKEAESFKDLKKEDKEYYDEDKLFNPYDDTRVLYDNGKEVKKVLVGIDMEVGELLLADKLNERGQKIDAVISHHPEGKAFANLSNVMGMQAGISNNFGVPINVAESVLGGRMSEVSRGVHPINHNRPVDVAKILDINFMSIHTPADNHVQKFLQEMFDKKKPEKVSDVVKILKDIPEFKEAAKNGAGPMVFCGNESRSAGKVMVDMTGGTGGPKEVYEKLSLAGVGTIVGMHINEESRKLAEEHHLNVVIAGHMASDSVGLNLLFDELEKKGLEVMTCSGFVRVKRG